MIASRRKSETHVSADIHTVVVGTPMTEGVRHAPNQYLGDRAVRIAIDDTANATREFHAASQAHRGPRLVEDELASGRLLDSHRP
jgi:hypothetical protein